MLREFEDKENLLAEMDEQVDAYREAGKEEAATRLEDQLTLIHTKFQVRGGRGAGRGQGQGLRPFRTLLQTFPKSRAMGSLPLLSDYMSFP